MVFIKKDFYKLLLYIRDKNLKDIINNREIFNTTEFEDFNNEDIQIVLYVTAIDNRDFTALNNLINYDINKKNIDYEIYIRDDHPYFLNIIFKNFKFYDNEFIINCCTKSNNRIPKSNSNLYNFINEKYKISISSDGFFDSNKKKVGQYLINCSLEGKEHLVKYLVQHGADVNKEGFNGETPLLSACKRGNESIVKYLIKHGANINVKNDYHYTPLEFACQKGNKSIVKYLIEHGAEVYEIPTFIMKDDYLIKWLIELGADINSQNSSDETFLLIACQNENENMVNYLIDRGADIDREDRYGNTPLIIACGKNNEVLIKYLVEHNADINKGFNESPLTIACNNGNENLIKYLVEHGADVNNDDGIKYSSLYDIEVSIPLAIAIENGNEQLVKYLVEHGANVNNDNTNGITLLSMTCKKENENIIKYLIEHGANVNNNNNNRNGRYFFFLIQLK